MICRYFHRWGPWESEFEETPDGWSGTYEIRTRECTRKHCDMFEEVTRCVSLSPAVVRLNRHYSWPWETSYPWEAP